MIRIKSAPADICMMSHKKKDSKIKDSKIKDSKITTILPIDKSIKIAKIKSKKQVLSTSSNILNDAISETNSFSFEENYIISFIISYISENIIKKDKLKNLEAFLIQNTIRFVISYIMHKHIIIDLIQTINLH